MAGLSKVDLFVNQCIDISYFCQGMSYWDAYYLPVPIRQHLIERVSKHLNRGKEDANDPQPLNSSERQKFQQKSKSIRNDAGIFSPQR